MGKGKEFWGVVLMPLLNILSRLKKQQISYRAIDKAQIVIELFIQIKFLVLTLHEI